MKRYLLFGSPSRVRAPLGVNSFIGDFDSFKEAEHHGHTCEASCDVGMLYDGIGLSMMLRLSWFHIWDTQDTDRIPYQYGCAIAEASYMTEEETSLYESSGGKADWSPYGDKTVDEVNSILDKQNLKV